MEWEIIESGPDTPQSNMQRDKELLAEQAAQPHPILHLYEWDRPSVTYGHFITPTDWLDETGIRDQGLSLARRPTGGGIVFHSFDLAFSVILPDALCTHNTLANYKLINSSVQSVIESVMASTTLLPTDPVPPNRASSHFCMAKPTIYDIMIEDKKVGGAAQRRTRSGLLHQATISIAPPPRSFLQAVLKPETGLLPLIEQNSFALLPRDWTESALVAIRLKLRKLLKETLLSSIGDAAK